MADAGQPGLQLFNSLSGKVEPFVPLEPEKVKMYVCGPTVYDDAHLGHARCYITWDVLYRFLKFLGYDVTYVRNVTDVDDKILNRAKEQGVAPSEVAEKNYRSFASDMQALNVLSPNAEPKATEYITQMIAGIEVLIQKGAAYVSADGSVYFRVASKADYGKLKYTTQDQGILKKHLEDLRAGARVEVGEIKENPLDFALWKGVSLDDPNAWESPWPAENRSKGWGRPGWHMECSAMNHAVFGEQIDIHAGGADLIFPHHENEIAQSEAWTGKEPFARYWLHNGFVNVSGEKMSKSLGNFSSIKKILERYDANTIRYFLLTNHYRMPVDFNDEALQAAENWVRKITKLLNDAKSALNVQEIDSKLLCTFTEMRSFAPSNPDNHFFELYLEMSEDLNTPKALAKINETLNRLKFYLMKPFDNQGTPIQGDLMSLFSISISMMHVLGFDLTSFLNSSQKELPKNEIQTIYKELSGQWMEPDREAEILLDEILQYRRKAKEIKNWGQADAIRKHLSDIGIQIMDNKDGTTTWELIRK